MKPTAKSRGRHFTTDHGHRVGSNARKLSRELMKIPVDRYRLATDGRKWQHVARQRMGLAEWLASHGNPDGSQICPAVGSMAKHFGWSRRTVFGLLSDLGDLKLLESEGHYTAYHGVRVRRMNIAHFLGREGVQDTAVGVQDSIEGVRDTKAGDAVTVQDSRVGVQCMIAHNRPVPMVSQIPDRPSLVDGELRNPGCETVIGFETDSPKSDDGSSAPKNESLYRLKAEAKQILIGAGHHAELVHIAVERVSDLADALDKTPRMKSYFVEGARRALQDPDERAEIERIFAGRAANRVPAGASLAHDEKHSKSKIKFVHRVVEDAVRLGKPSREVLADRLKNRS